MKASYVQINGSEDQVTFFILYIQSTWSHGLDQRVNCLCLTSYFEPSMEEVVNYC